LRFCQFCSPQASTPLYFYLTLQNWGGVWYHKSMMKNKKLVIGIAIFASLSGFTGWYIYRDITKEFKPQPSLSLGVSANPAEDSLPLIEKQKPNGGQSSVTNFSRPEEEIEKQISTLDRKIAVKANLQESTKNKAIMDIKEITAKLKEDYDQLQEWLQLGLLRNLIGDYEGAKQAWEFAAVIRPKDPVAFHNLGDLHWMQLSDFPKAEKYFSEAIEKGPQHPLFYIKLHELYRYSYKEKSDLADDVLEQGIKTTGDPYLKSLLEEYRKETK